MNQNSDSYRIVLADDHVLIRHGIKNIIIQDESLEIVGEVGDGDELLHCLEEGEADLLILDISMPKVSGIDLAEVVKKKFPLMKVLMLTMHKNKQFFYGAMSAGADGYLIKSDSDEELLLAINKIRDGRTYISPYLADDFTEDVLNAYRNQETSPFKGLTKREKQILGLVVDGYTSKDMAKKLNLSPRTVDHHRSNLLKKFKMKNSVDLVNYAVRNGYVAVE
ncbi:MAG: DNA-binding response regulator [Desulfobulbaceae bacterium]|nr:MAG: DNA-binding response regulator [Desulfobulbaceae bacterium]